MWEQKQLLQTFIEYYDLNHDEFVIDDEDFKIEVKDIYFLIGLSW